MARITVEDCLTQENNRFALVLLAAKRTKQILQGSKVLSTDAKSNKAVVASLREIAEGQVGFMSAEEVAAAKLQEEREAEERAKEAFAKISQASTESNGKSLLADIVDIEDEEEEVVADEEVVVAEDEIADADDSSDDEDEGAAEEPGEDT